jgi:hypothetical protein
MRCILAGDVFDTGTPPSYARELYNQFVVELQRTGAHLVVLAAITIRWPCSTSPGNCSAA